MRIARTAALLATSMVVGVDCGGTSAKILESIDAGSPPSANLRVDAFLIRAVSSCAVGSPCATADPTSCFYVTDSSGPRTTFAVGLREPAGSRC